MSSYINTNIPSLNSQNHLRFHSQQLSSTIEKLASGMRINRGSDDASGLAISEKMRGQIRGVDRAMANAQDGMSLVQTADGALNETAGILQRMRELAVQAANDTYTPSDRLHVQREIDQLRQEIDRVASSTEFNTKKLLSGDAAARWSVSDPGSLEAIIRDRVQSGTYQLDVSAKAGKNQVLRSNIMTLRDGAFAGDILTGNGVALTASTNSSGIAGIYAAEGVRTGSLDERTYHINVTSYDVANTTIEGNSTISITAANVGFMGVYQQAGSNWAITAGGGQDAATANQQTNIVSFGGIVAGRHGYLELRFDDDVDVDSNPDVTGLASVRFIDVKTGEAGAWASVDLVAGELNLAGSGAQTFDGAAVFGGGASLSVTGNVKQGDKALFSINAAVAAADVGSMSMGAGAIKIDERFSNDVGTASVVDYRGAYYIDTQSSGIQNMQLTDGNQQITYHLAQLESSTGSVSIGSITLDMQADSTGTKADSSILAEVRGTSGLASAYTRLEDIDAFLTSDGLSVFLAPQQLTLYGNDRQVNVTLQGSDTLADVERKFTTAITNGLGMGTGISSVDNHAVDFIARGSGLDSTHAAVAGTMLFRSLINGAQGRIGLAGEDAVIGGFNLATLQNPEENRYMVRVSEAHSGRAVGFGEVSGSMLRDLIPGMDIAVKGNVGIDTSFNDSRARYDFTSQATPSPFTLHVVDNSPSFQVGANPGQSINMPIGRMDSRALELENLMVLDTGLANEAIARIDRAIGMVSEARGKMGAVANRMDHTINSLAVAHESMQAAESRIRDVNVAKEISNLVRSQMLTESATIMLGKANMLPDGVMSLLRNA
ncbi:flagellin [Desulfurispirillum indicum]|uniref:flagellin N-terminal helical domain-containing protein n=1 Tax=Desulfurispirillum indicum TaxID=936456 RepID=UPI001CFC27DC|nr:flagellin [Desulfurispirillum indicum]UCZ56210.1 flagellin [Desulfurispirillum indicum]